MGGNVGVGVVLPGKHHPHAFIQTNKKTENSDRDKSEN